MLTKLGFNFSESMRNVGKISFGTIIGQILSILSLPIFTRLYGPVAIGNWTFFNSIAILMNSFSDLGLINAIMVEKEEIAAERLYTIISTISLLFSLLSGLGVYVYYIFFPSSYNLSALEMSIFIFLLMFTLQQVQVCYTWLNRRKEYSVLMKNPVISNSVILFLAILFSKVGIGQYGYYIAVLTGQIVTLIHMKIWLPKKIFCFNINTYKDVFYEKKKFMTYQTISNIIIQMKSQAPVILIQTFFGAELLGYYSLSVRVLNMPVTFLANALGKVFFQKASEIQNHGYGVGSFTLKTLNQAMKIAVLPIAILLSTGDIVSIIMFGSEYTVAGNIIRIMVFYGFFLFLSMSVTGVAIVIDRQKFMIISGIMQMIGFTVGIWIGASIFNSIYMASFLLSVSFIFIQLIYFIAILKTMNVPLSEYFFPLLKNILIVVVIYIAIRGALLLLGIVNNF